MKISPSLLAANFYNLENELKRLNESNIDYLHLDVMDGNFVPNISFGPAIIKQIRPYFNKPFDVHLMINNPRKYLKVFKDAGADFITYHLEVEENHFDLINEIHMLGMKAGLSIKPNTNVEELIPYLPNIDLVLVMSVEPGFGGQSFMDSCLPKIEFLKQYKNLNNLNYEIIVDGGINYQTAVLVKNAGCDCVVAGTYLFKGNIQELVNELKEI